MDELNRECVNCFGLCCVQAEMRHHLRFAVQADHDGLDARLRAGSGAPKKLMFSE